MIDIDVIITDTEILQAVTGTSLCPAGPRARFDPAEKHGRAATQPLVATPLDLPHLHQARHWWEQAADAGNS